MHRLTFSLLASLVIGGIAPAAQGQNQTSKNQTGKNQTSKKQVGQPNEAAFQAKFLTYYERVKKLGGPGFNEWKDPNEVYGYDWLKRPWRMDRRLGIRRRTIERSVGNIVQGEAQLEQLRDAYYAFPHDKDRLFDYATAFVRSEQLYQELRKKNRKVGRLHGGESYQERWMIRVLLAYAKDNRAEPARIQFLLQDGNPTLIRQGFIQFADRIATAFPDDSIAYLKRAQLYGGLGTTAGYSVAIRLLNAHLIENPKDFAAVGLLFHTHLDRFDTPTRRQPNDRDTAIKLAETLLNHLRQSQSAGSERIPFLQKTIQRLKRTR